MPFEFLPSYKGTYDTFGYVHLPPGLISSELFPKLQKAAENVIAKTRKGEWNYRRVVGKQFPPYGDANEDSWGAQHVMHPELGEDAKPFREWYESEELGVAVRGLIGCKEGDEVMELFNLLINPESHDFALCWHRDDVRHDASEEEERKALGIWHYGVQWNTALFEDSCLYVVPHSHLQPRTKEQRDHSSTTEPPQDPMNMPGAIRVTLKPGESVFYNSNILHCATYTSSAPRATLHGCMGSVQAGSSRARNILQHGLEWMKNDPAFTEGFGERGKGMLARLVQMADGAEKDGRAYSLAG